MYQYTVGRVGLEAKSLPSPKTAAETMVASSGMHHSLRGEFFLLLWTRAQGSVQHSMTTFSNQNYYVYSNQWRMNNGRQTVTERGRQRDDEIGKYADRSIHKTFM